MRRYRKQGSGGMDLISLNEDIDTSIMVTNIFDMLCVVVKNCLILKKILHGSSLFYILRMTLLSIPSHTPLIK
ncbi:hypothetical protein CHISP_2344 [Chitinispirillum alkaliphilum]|nr:hypothetical protein CHISP_2344 [Chitinispirillum alkaliphilum]